MTTLNNAEKLKLGSLPVSRAYLGSARVWPPLSWTQMGADISVGSESEYGGWSVSLSDDGNTFAIGAPFAGESAAYFGFARVYEWDGSNWSQKGGEIAGSSAGDCSGWSVSINGSGTVLAVGSPFHDGAGTDSGQVTVYEWDGTGWIQKGSPIGGAASGDTAGWSVSLSQNGNTLAIGSPLADTESGSVKVYVWNGAEWSLVGSPVTGSPGEHAGCSVSLSSAGTSFATGAPTANKVQTYSFDGSGWVAVGPEITGENTGDQSGYGVCLSGDANTVAVGAPFNDGSGADSGHVRIKSWNGTSWSPVGSDIDGEFPGRQVGCNVSMSGDGNTVATGTPLNADAQPNPEAIRVFAWDGSSWRQKGNIIPNSEKGCCVSLDAAGNTLALGLPLGSASNSGTVRIYRLN